MSIITEFLATRNLQNFIPVCYCQYPPAPLTLTVLLDNPAGQHTAAHYRNNKNSQDDSDRAFLPGQHYIAMVTIIILHGHLVIILYGHLVIILHVSRYLLSFKEHARSDFYWFPILMTPLLLSE